MKFNLVHSVKEGRNFNITLEMTAEEFFETIRSNKNKETLLILLDNKEFLRDSIADATKYIFNRLEAYHLKNDNKVYAGRKEFRSEKTKELIAQLEKSVDEDMKYNSEFSDPEFI